MPRVKVRVIVVSYRSGSVLQKCLKALRRQTFEDFEVVIVDNDSRDGSLDAALPDDRRFSALWLQANTGFAAANNRGAVGATSPWIATLNPDAFPEPNWLEALLEATRRYPDVAMFGSTQFSARNPAVFDGTGDVYAAFGLAWRANQGRPVADGVCEGETFGPCAAAALYKMDAFRRAGGFDERYFCYYEDVDLAFRLRLMGERCIQVPDAIVHHVGSSVEGDNRDFILYHSSRNLFWTFVKDMPGPLFLLLLPFHLGFIMLMLARAAQRGRFGPTARGLRDGLRMLGPIWQSRRQIQSARTTSWLDIAKTLTWSPAKFLRARADMRESSKHRRAA